METDGNYSVQFNWDDTASVAYRVVEAVAEVTGGDPKTVDSLATAVDPDALEALFAPRSSGEQRNEGHLTFPVAGCDVTVYARGEVAVHE
jgi:hypothetical protein